VSADRPEQLAVPVSDQPQDPERPSRPFEERHDRVDFVVLTP
jgi:hypothetical protein